jgi:ubiquitin
MTYLTRIVWYNTVDKTPRSAHNAFIAGLLGQPGQLQVCLSLIVPEHANHDTINPNEQYITTTSKNNDREFADNGTHDNCGAVDRNEHAVLGCDYLGRRFYHTANRKRFNR